ncbi:class I SAM-dependent methyltransferase [Virgibacillus kimchii]
MEKSNVETLYEWLDRTTVTIENYVKAPYLDCLTYTLEILFYREVPEEWDEKISHKLSTALQEIEKETLDKPDVRKAVQLAILKGMKGSTQQQHLMTPDTVALIVGYLAEKLTAEKKELRIFDPAGGTGNLITTVLDQLQQPVDAFASEVDPTLIQLAVLNANLQERQIEFFHQDSLQPFLMDPVDLVIADLPVGYYPDDIRASNYELKADQGHSYAHHLFIEQALNYTKESGYLIFVIPEFLFDSDQSDKLHRFLREYAHIVGVLRLPETAFASKQNIKSILILQKKGNNTQAPKQPLLAQVPSFKNTNALSRSLGQMNEWFQSYKEEKTN